MTENRNTYQDESGGEKTLQKLFELRVVQILLAGMYFLFGIKLTKAEKMYRREQAILMRKSISAANLVIETLKGNRDAFDGFTNDYGPSWRERMQSLSLNTNNPHPEAVTSIDVTGTRRARIMAANVALRGTNPSSPRASARPQDEGIGVRAPP